VQSPEECDDGNTLSTDSCLNTCKKASCGDSFVQTDVETCDDGNATDGDGCTSTCQIEPPANFSLLLGDGGCGLIADASSEGTGRVIPAAILLMGLALLVRKRIQG
jgi:cysteine-rich repeat protein